MTSRLKNILALISVFFMACFGIWFYFSYKYDSMQQRRIVAGEILVDMVEVQANKIGDLENTETKNQNFHIDGNILTSQNGERIIILMDNETLLGVDFDQQIVVLLKRNDGAGNNHPHNCYVFPREAVLSDCRFLGGDFKKLNTR